MCVIVTNIVFKCFSVQCHDFLFEFIVRSRTLDPDP